MGQSIDQKNWMALAGNYASGDVVAFHRRYKRLGVEKGEEQRVVSVDQDSGRVGLRDKDGTILEWIPGKLAALSGGVEVYRSEEVELRRGDRVRWTRNNFSLGLVNSQTAEVTGVNKDTVAFRLEDGGELELHKGDSQLRHIDRAWVSTVHAFQGRTVDTVIAAMEANHPHLTTQKIFYVEINRARHRAELVTDDRNVLGEHLEAATGERVAALETLEPVGQRTGAGREGAIVDRERTLPDTIERDAAEVSRAKMIESDLEL